MCSYNLSIKLVHVIWSNIINICNVYCGFIPCFNPKLNQCGVVCMNVFHSWPLPMSLRYRDFPLTVPENGLLILNMLNCVKLNKHVFTFSINSWVWFDTNRWGGSQMLTILHRQCRACRCSGDFRSQCISRHGIDPVKNPGIFRLQHQNNLYSNRNP